MPSTLNPEGPICHAIQAQWHIDTMVYRHNGIQVQCHTGAMIHRVNGQSTTDFCNMSGPNQAMHNACLLFFSTSRNSQTALEWRLRSWPNWGTTCHAPTDDIARNRLTLKLTYLDLHTSNRAKSLANTTCQQYSQSVQQRPRTIRVRTEKTHEKRADLLVNTDEKWRKILVDF